MDVVILIGRILFSALFLFSGAGHLTQSKTMAQYAAGKGVPLPQVSVLLSGAVVLVGGLSVLLGIWADLGSLLLVAFLVPTAAIMHGFWSESDPTTRQTEMIQFNKDLALAGAALMLFAFFAHNGDLGLTITGPLFTVN
ncbi:putative oxidoreductase [Rhodococcus sp. LBL1]|nr:putative oxidoreductase [Rhodococcus sp. LBL1]MDH6682433.1 putative oxidoreductase [Rhodococcus sp. LBL2]WFR73508.1 DoxX family protein [Prescottella defluvii]